MRHTKGRIALMGAAVMAMSMLGAGAASASTNEPGQSLQVSTAPGCPWADTDKRWRDNGCPWQDNDPRWNDHGGPR